MVEAFLHKQHLEPGELSCLVNGTSSLAGEVMTVSENAMVLLQEVLGGKNGISSESSSAAPAPPPPPLNDGAGSISAMVDQMQAEEQGATTASAPQQPAPVPQPAPIPAPKPQADPEASKSLNFFYGNRRLQLAAMAMSAPMIFMQLGMSMKEIVSLAQKIVEKCVQGDALKAFEVAGRHMQSMQYVSGHIVANGADVVTELADALQAYQRNDFRTFGLDMGRVFRKVLLSNNTNGQLPEGLPSKVVLANVTAGLLRGFFGEGFALDIQTEPGYDPVHVDLHECVGTNLPFFQTIFGTTMFFYGQKASQDQSGGNVQEKGSAPWGAALAMTMMQVPQAMSRCGLGESERDMLMDAVKRLGAGLHYQLETPQATSISEDQVAHDMATTVKDWAQHEYYTFGLHLGGLLQEMYLEVYGQKWSVDASGTLRRVWEGSSLPLLSAPFALLAMLPGFAVLAAFRGMRGLSKHHEAVLDVDCEEREALSPHPVE